jgi:hypothetical protein
MTASTTVTKSDTKYSKHHAWWMLVLVLVCIPAALVSEPLSESFGQIMPETLPNTSSYNKKASGYSALFELCQKVGIPSHRWEGSYRELIKHTKGTLVIVLPSEPLSRHEVDSLMKWVQQGNDLVYLDYLGYRSGQKVLDPLKLHASSRTEVKDKDIVADSKIPETANAISLRANADVVIFGGEKVIGPDDKSAYLTTLKHGKGRVLVGSLTDFAANRHIANPAYRNNFQFMMNWFDTSQKPILFDEKAHGYTCHHRLHQPEPEIRATAAGFEPSQDFQSGVHRWIGFHLRTCARQRYRLVNDIHTAEGAARQVAWCRSALTFGRSGEGLVRAFRQELGGIHGLSGRRAQSTGSPQADR